MREEQQGREARAVVVGARREARASIDLDQSPTLPTPDRSDIARDNTQT